MQPHRSSSFICIFSSKKTFLFCFVFLRFTRSRLISLRKLSEEKVNLENNNLGEHLHCDSEFHRLPRIYATEQPSARMMKSKTLFLLSGFIIKCVSANFIDVDTTLDPGLVNQNQAFLNRKEKFIKFDTKDNELEIELGISVPFIKVPLAPGKHLSGAKESRISINAPGLIVAGMLMLTSFLIIPLLFTTNSEQGFGFQRKQKSSVWSLMEGLNEVLSKNGIDSSSCMQKSICWISKTSKDGKEGSVGKWVDYFLKTWWLSRLIRGTLVEEAVKAGSDGASCGAKYSHCSLAGANLQSVTKMILSGHH